LIEHFLPECLSHCEFFLADRRLRRAGNRNRLFLDIRADPIPLAVLRRPEYGTVALRTNGASHEADGAVNALEQHFERKSPKKGRPPCECIPSRWRKLVAEERIGIDHQNLRRCSPFSEHCQGERALLAVAKSHDKKPHVDRVEIVPHRLGRKSSLEPAVTHKKDLGPTNAIDCRALESVQDSSMFVVCVLRTIAVGEKMVIAITRGAAFEIVDRHLGNATDENAKSCA